MSQNRAPIAVTVSLLLISLSSAAANRKWQCWGPDLPDPCRNALAAVTLVPDSGGGEVWAAGNAGTVLSGNGSSWQKRETSTGARLVDISMASSDRGWAVGDEGTLLEWRNQQWSEVTDVIGGDTQARAVSAVPGRDEAWVAADWMGFGRFYRYNGFRWSDDGDTYNGVLYDMEFVDENTGWAISYSVGDTVFYRFNGSWEVVYRSPNWLFAISFDANGNGWAVGADGVIEKWDGSEWTELDAVTTDYLYGVAAVNASEAWAVGACGTILRWDGSSWSEAGSPIGCVQLNDIVFDNASVGWAVGDGGLILRYDGERWAALNMPAIRSIRGLSQTPGTTDDLWAVGYGDYLLHWNGSLWSPVPGPAYTYDSVAMLGSDDGWASGSHAFHRWDGLRWSKIQDGESATAMAFSSPSDGWAVGWRTMQRWNGTSWTSVESPLDATYQGIAAVAPDDVWALGYNDGEAAHFDGASWTPVQVPDIGSFGDICMVDADLGYIVGGSFSNGAVLRYVNNSWTQVTIPSEADDLNAVDVRRFDTGLVGWIVGNDGYIIRIAGDFMIDEPTPTGSDLLDVATVSATEAWAVGRDGVILHWGESLPADDIQGAMIPATAKAAGQAGTDWRTDVTLMNLADDTATVDLEVWMRDQANPNPEQRTISLQPKACVVEHDVLGGLFGLPDSSTASLLIRADEPLAVASRTYNATAEGTYGQSIPTTRLTRVFGAGQPAVLVGLEENPSARSNLGIVNITEAEIEVSAEFFDDAGTTLGSVAYAVPARGSIQRTRVLRDVVSGSVDAAWAELRSADGSFMAYVSTVDAETGDPVYRPAMAPTSATQYGVMQGIAKVGGIAGTDWRSSLTLVNPTDGNRGVTLGLLLRGQPNPTPDEITLTLAPHEIHVVDDVLSDLFGLDSGAASIAVQASAGMILSGRTFNQTDNGTYGQYIPLQHGTNAIMAGGRGVFVGVTQDESFRSNLGLTNSLPGNVWVALTLLDNEGNQVGSRQAVQVRTGESLQVDRVAQLFSTDDIEGATLVVELSTGSAVDAYLSIIDARTGDPVFLLPTID